MGGKDLLMGEEIDKDAMQAANEKFSIGREIRSRLTGNEY